MNWILQANTKKPSEFQLVSKNGQVINFKFSSSQQSIRMRFQNNYGVFSLDEGSFQSRKFSIRNVYGSEVGLVTKGAWRESSGTIALNDLSAKINYRLDTKNRSLEIEFNKTASVHFPDAVSDENSFLALIVLAWMESVTAGAILATA